MSPQLCNPVPGLASSFIAAPTDGPGQSQPVGEFSDLELMAWVKHCNTQLVDSDMRYLTVGNERARWFLLTQEAERELARRRAS